MKHSGYARLLRRWFRYRFNLLFTRGRATQFILLGVVAAVVVLLGLNAFFFGLYSQDALEAEGIDNRFGGGFLDTLWWSLKHVIDPGAFAEDYGAPWPVILISLLLSVLGLAILGLFIAFTASSVQNQLRLVRKGSTEVMERDHVLILGWSRKIAPILDSLAAAVTRRTVVLLAPLDVDDMQDALRRGMRGWRNLKLVLRSGTTDSLDELERVGVARARSIIAVGREAAGNTTREADIETIKTLMLLSGYEGWAETRPRMVAEITQKRNVEIAAIASAGTIPLVSSSEIISKLIVQAARQPGIASVYSEIFSYRGNTAFVSDCPEAAGRSFGELSHWFTDSVPIGVAWRSKDGLRTHVALNPESDYEPGEGEQLVLLARRPAPARDPHRPAPPASFDGDGKKRRRRLDRILVLGWNENIDEILGEFDAHSSHDALVTVVANHDESFVDEYLESALPKPFRNISIDYRRAGAANRRTLAALSPETYDAVITLADESHGEQDPDARTIMTLLVLGDVVPRDRLPHVVVEIHDGSNRDLVSATIARDVIVSPRMVSLQLAQISRDPVVGAIYRELLSAGGIEVGLQPASRYVALGRSCSFDEVVAATQRHTEIAIGVRVGDRHSPVMLNPEKSCRWVFGADDRIAVLAQQVYE